MLYAVVVFDSNSDEKCKEIHEKITKLPFPIKEESPVYFVYFDGKMSELGKLIDMDPEVNKYPVSGMIVEADRVYGYGPAELWDWMDNEQSKVEKST